MRTRKDIEKTSDSFNPVTDPQEELNHRAVLQLEVLLDIRDYMKELIRLLETRLPDERSMPL